MADDEKMETGTESEQAKGARLCGTAVTVYVQCVQGSSLPYVHLRHYSCDKCFEAFPVFATLPLSVYYTEHKLNNRDGGGLGTGLYL